LEVSGAEVIAAIFGNHQAAPTRSFAALSSLTAAICHRLPSYLPVIRMTNRACQTTQNDTLLRHLDVYELFFVKDPLA
jgi:hypothetical protein